MKVQLVILRVKFDRGSKLGVTTVDVVRKLTLYPSPHSDYFTDSFCVLQHI